MAWAVGGLRGGVQVKPLRTALGWDAGWFRVFGYGLRWTCHEPLYSERYGDRKPFMHLWRYRFFFLKPPA